VSSLTRPRDRRSLWPGGQWAAQAGTRSRRGPLRRHGGPGHSLSRTGLLWVLLVGLALLGSGWWGAVNAAAPLHHAGLIVRHGDGRLTYAYVSFLEEEITGIELLHRSEIEQVTIPFGGLGEGVCSLEREGCPVGPCRRTLCQEGGSDSPYWQYFRQDTTGTWRWLTLGASATTVHDGDIDGWSWTGRDPGLPARSLLEIASLVGAADVASSDGDIPPPYRRTIGPPGAERPPSRNDRSLGLAGAGATVLLLLAAALVVVLLRARALPRDPR
jgi:hypothetical protein